MCMPTSSEPMTATCQSIESKQTAVTIASLSTKKSVSFNPKVTKRSPKQRHHFDQKQADSMWYNQDEMKAMRKYARKIVKNPCIMEATGDCYRGLEVFANNNRVNKYEAQVRPVLEMHWNNRAMGVDDDLGVPTYAARINEEPTLQGIIRGAHDAGEAFQIYQEDFDFKAVQESYDQTTYNTMPEVPAKQDTARFARSA